MQLQKAVLTIQCIIKADIIKESGSFQCVFKNAVYKELHKCVKSMIIARHCDTRLCLSCLLDCSRGFPWNPGVEDSLGSLVRPCLKQSERQEGNLDRIKIGGEHARKQASNQSFVSCLLQMGLLLGLRLQVTFSELFNSSLTLVEK